MRIILNFDIRFFVTFFLSVITCRFSSSIFLLPISVAFVYHILEIFFFHSSPASQDKQFLPLEICRILLCPFAPAHNVNYCLVRNVKFISDCPCLNFNQFVTASIKLPFIFYIHLYFTGPSVSRFVIIRSISEKRRENNV